MFPKYFYLFVEDHIIIQKLEEGSENSVYVLKNFAELPKTKVMILKENMTILFRFHISVCPYFERLKSFRSLSLYSNTLLGVLLLSICCMCSIDLYPVYLNLTRMFVISFLLHH